MWTDLKLKLTCANPPWQARSSLEGRRQLQKIPPQGRIRVWMREQLLARSLRWWCCGGHLHGRYTGAQGATITKTKIYQVRCTVHHTKFAGTQARIGLGDGVVCALNSHATGIPTFSLGSERANGFTVGPRMTQVFPIRVQGSCRFRDMFCIFAQAQRDGMFGLLNDTMIPTKQFLMPFCAQ